MRLATKAQIAALTTLVLCAAVSAQTLRSPQDPRNQAPAVGTGGPVPGPTGLFTVYDGARSCFSAPPRCVRERRLSCRQRE